MAVCLRSPPLSDTQTYCVPGGTTIAGPGCASTAGAPVTAGGVDSGIGLRMTAAAAASFGGVIGTGSGVAHAARASAVATTIRDNDCATFIRCEPREVWCGRPAPSKARSIRRAPEGLPSGRLDQGLICPRISPSLCASLCTFTYRLPALYAVSWASVSLAPAGTFHLPSPSLTSGMMTPPLFPGAASWMCAAVPLTPVVVTLPDTVLSLPNVSVPLPLAVVVTGGTS